MVTHSNSKCSVSSLAITTERQRIAWSQDEVDNLVSGVQLYGVGEWKQIANHFEFNKRTPVDLKDKWRNLQKIAEKNK